MYTVAASVRIKFTLFQPIIRSGLRDDRHVRPSRFLTPSPAATHRQPQPPCASYTVHATGYDVLYEQRFGHTYRLIQTFSSSITQLFIIWFMEFLIIHSTMHSNSWHFCRRTKIKIQTRVVFELFDFVWLRILWLYIIIHQSIRKVKKIKYNLH